MRLYIALKTKYLLNWTVWYSSVLNQSTSNRGRSFRFKKIRRIEKGSQRTQPLMTNNRGVAAPTKTPELQLPTRLETVQWFSLFNDFFNKKQNYFDSMKSFSLDRKVTANFVLITKNLKTKIIEIYYEINKKNHFLLICFSSTSV